MTVSTNVSNLATAIEAYKNSSRGVVVAVEAILSTYALVENARYGTTELEQALPLFAEFPRLQQAAIKVVRKLTGVSIKREEQVFTITNSKAQKTGNGKADIRSAINDFIALELTSLLNFDVAKGAEKVKTSAEQLVAFGKRLDKQMETMIEAGVSYQQILDLIKEKYNLESPADSE